MSERAKGDGGIHATPGNDHVCSAIERLSDRLSAKVRVGTEQPRGQRRAGEHLSHVTCAQLLDTRHKIVTGHHRDHQIQP